MVSQILEIQKRSNQYIANLEANIVRVIESNSDQIVDANRMQMIISKNAEDKPLIHNRTGKATLSKAYARRMGKTKPDFFVSGKFQNEMFMFMPSMKEYFVASKSGVSKWLSINYNKIFGVSPKNQLKIQKINDADIVSDYRKNVFI